MNISRALLPLCAALGMAPLGSACSDGQILAQIQPRAGRAL